MITLLNGAPASHSLFRFWKTSCFLLSSFRVINRGLSLSSVTFQSDCSFDVTIAHIDLAHVPQSFFTPSPFLSSGLLFMDSGNSKMMIFFLLFCHSFSSLDLSLSQFLTTSSTFFFHYCPLYLPMFVHPGAYLSFFTFLHLFLYIFVYLIPVILVFVEACLCVLYTYPQCTCPLILLFLLDLYKCCKTMRHSQLHGLIES